jgi:hypothetical protein
MKALAKLFTEFIAWRWAPAVALLAASMVYVIVVVGVVPSEIGIPVANAKFSQRSLARPVSTTPSEEGATSYANAANDTPAAPPPAPATRHGAADFGRRGFSPRLDRPEPPPPPAPAIPPPPPPVMPPPAPTNPGAISNIFSRIQGALRPGAAAAAAAAASAQQLAAQPPAEQAAPAAPAAPGAEPPAPNAPDAPPAQGEAPAAPGAPSAAPAAPTHD